MFVANARASAACTNPRDAGYPTHDGNVLFFSLANGALVLFSYSRITLFSVSQVTQEELVRLFRKFRKLDTDKSGSLSAEEFMAIPELEHNPLVRRVVSTFDANRSGEVDFIEFIQALTIFAKPPGEKAAEEEKFRFTFKLYDVDSDGFISNADLFQILKAMVGSNLNEVQLQQLVDRTMRQGDKDLDGKLSYEEFLGMVKTQDIGEKLKLEGFGRSIAGPVNTVSISTAGAGAGASSTGGGGGAGGAGGGGGTGPGSPPPGTPVGAKAGAGAKGGHVRSSS